MNRALLGLFALTALLFSLTAPAHAQQPPVEQEFRTRIGANIEKKLVKDLRLVLSPELRTVEGFNPDRYLIEIGLKYDPIKYLSLRPGFRADLKESNIGLENSYRPRMDVVGSYKIEDFEPSARLRYTYSFGPYMDPEHTLRYRLGLGYDIGKTDVSVEVGAEAFHDLVAGNIYKMRYSAGGDYKFYKTKKLDQWIRLTYNLDYYLIEYRNVHFVELGYKVVF